MRSVRVAVAVFSFGFVVLGCSGSKPPETAGTQGESSKSGEEVKPETPATEKPEASAPKSNEPEADTTPRDVKYIVTGGRVEVEVAGCRFKPSAKAIKIGDGWGVKLTVEGEAKDDKMHSLLQTSTGPLAFAGKVMQGGKEIDINDKREGGEDGLVAPGTPTTFEREWPGKSGMKPLKKGDKIELQVGLWGLAATPNPADRRLVRKFIVVTMNVEKADPRPLVAAPE